VLDDLYGIALVDGLEADVVVVGVPDGNSSLLTPDIYRRPEADLRAEGRRLGVAAATLNVTRQGLAAALVRRSSGWHGTSV
jgi:hypothetical protein